MKQIWMILLLLCVALPMKAQQDENTGGITVRAGLIVSNITDDFLATDPKWKPAFMVGLDYTWQFTEKFAGQIGLAYSRLGAKGASDLVDDNYNLNMDYLSIPIMANYYLFEGFALKAGVEPAFKMNVRAEYKGISENEEAVLAYMSGLTGVNMKIYNMMVSIPVGVSYELGPIVLDARYNIGVSNMVNFCSTKTSHFSASVGYKF